MKNTGTSTAIVLIVVLAALLLGGAGMMGFGGFGMMGGYGGYGGMMGGYGNQFSFGFNPIGTIISLVVWALVIGGIVLLVVWLARSVNGATTVSNNSAIEIAKARYAHGEITKEQYDEMKKVLEA